MVFWIPNQPDFEFLEKGEITEQVTHSNIVLSGTLTILDAGQLEAPDLVREFLDVFSENLPRLMQIEKLILRLMCFLELPQSQSTIPDGTS